MKVHGRFLFQLKDGNMQYTDTKEGITYPTTVIEMQDAKKFLLPQHTEGLDNMLLLGKVSGLDVEHKGVRDIYKDDKCEYIVTATNTPHIKVNLYKDIPRYEVPQGTGSFETTTGAEIHIRYPIEAIRAENSTVHCYTNVKERCAIVADRVVLHCKHFGSNSTSVNFIDFSEVEHITGSSDMFQSSCITDAEGSAKTLRPDKLKRFNLTGIFATYKGTLDLRAFDNTHFYVGDDMLSGFVDTVYLLPARYKGKINCSFVKF